MHIQKYFLRFPIPLWRILSYIYRCFLPSSFYSTNLVCIQTIQNKSFLLRITKPFSLEYSYKALVKSRHVSDSFLWYKQDYWKVTFYFTTFVPRVTPIPEPVSNLLQRTCNVTRSVFRKSAAWSFGAKCTFSDRRCNFIKKRENTFS